MNPDAECCNPTPITGIDELSNQLSEAEKLISGIIQIWNELSKVVENPSDSGVPNNPLPSVNTKGLFGGQIQRVAFINDTLSTIAVGLHGIAVLLNNNCNSS